MPSDSVGFDAWVRWFLELKSSLFHNLVFQGLSPFSLPCHCAGVIHTGMEEVGTLCPCAAAAGQGLALHCASAPLCEWT